MSKAIFKAIVKDNNDPEKLDRIKVTNNFNPNVKNKWLNQVIFTQYNQPIPEIGSTVVVFYDTDKSSSAFYIPITVDNVISLIEIIQGLSVALCN